MKREEVKIQKLKKYFSELNTFGEKLTDTAQKLTQAIRNGKFPERGHEFRYSQEDPKDSLNRSVDITRKFEFLVAVTGAFSSGKSTLLNVLLDCPDLLPSSAIPLTAVCTVVRYGETPQFQVRYVSYEDCFQRAKEFIGSEFLKPFGGEEDLVEALEHPERFLAQEEDQLSLQRFARFISSYEEIAQKEVKFHQRPAFIAGGGVLETTENAVQQWKYFLPTPAQKDLYHQAGGTEEHWVTKEWLACIRDVTLWIDSPLLKNNIVFLDLPGLNCREDYHRRAVREYCNLADCIVLTAFQPGNQADEEVIQNFKQLSNNYREKLFFVLNRIDQFQTEPEELARAFDYLSRYGIGEEFPLDRCFLTSAYLARENLLSSPKFESHFKTFQQAFSQADSSIAKLHQLIVQACKNEDPGGMNNFKTAIRDFLNHQAYPTKIKEVLHNFESTVEKMKGSVEPRFAQALKMNPEELRSIAIKDYYSQIQKYALHSIYRFQNEYLRGAIQKESAFYQDLKDSLKKTHQEIYRKIVSHFNQPLEGKAPTEDPVSEFDLLRIAEDSSQKLKTEFLNLITTQVVARVKGKLKTLLESNNLQDHLDNIFHSSPSLLEEFDGVFKKFELLIDHSIRCIIRKPFYSMPGGKDLRRLKRNLSISELKPQLIQVFSEFYPDWIFQNIYSELQEQLALSFYLDSENLQSDLKDCFNRNVHAFTQVELMKNVRLPEDFTDSKSELFEIVGICKSIEGLEEEQLKLRHRAPLSA